ncbi:MAG: hypothetical protein U1E15_12490 [Hyphomicrobiales bacterium]
MNFEGGAWDGDGISSQTVFDGVASFSMPLGCALGLQLDAGAGSFDLGSAAGAGAHLFMRDPSSYLLGLHGTYESWNFDAPATDVNFWTLAAEGELYLGNISLEGEAGLVDANVGSADFAGRLTAAYYLNDDFRMALGVHQLASYTTGIASAEWQMDSMPLSLTLEGQMGENGYQSATVGLKFYFGGEQKTLIRRHREDDPTDGLFNNQGGAATAGGVLGAGGNDCPSGKLQPNAFSCNSASKPVNNCCPV